ncbi:MAG: hypothetical protein NTW53_17815 [Burkholderiales bacterium]|nr:hypothetical protein [Burkholderiales bacterium]
MAHWLAGELAGDTPTIVGIDHALSFPLRYFEVHQLAPDWMAFLEDFHRHWPTDAPHTYVDFILNGPRGQGAERMGNPRWMRLTDDRCRVGRSVFQFEGQGKVAAATHAGLPWILYLKRQLGDRLHVWPFDGWSIPAGKSALVEVRPAMWRDQEPMAALTPGQKDAFVTASWLKRADESEEFAAALQPPLSPPDKLLSAVEGWILGCEASARIGGSRVAKAEGRRPHLI